MKEDDLPLREDRSTSEDEIRKEFSDSYALGRRLNKQNPGFIGANRRRQRDLGITGLSLDFESASPYRVHDTSDDQIGTHHTPSVQEQSEQVVASPASSSMPQAAPQPASSSSVTAAQNTPSSVSNTETPQDVALSEPSTSDKASPAGDTA